MKRGASILLPLRAGADSTSSLGVMGLLRPGVFLELAKIRISALSTLSAATGYVAYLRNLSPDTVTVALGVMCLAMGACTMNQVQDRDIDRRMERTCRRPIPSGAITATTALVIAVLLVLGGFLLLWLKHNISAASLGLLAVAWYNGIYTYLKRTWAFAVVPGALIGALPPAVGWTAAGGDILDPRLRALMFFFFVWQVPHFWLLLFSFGRDYEQAGLPAATQRFRARQFANLTFIWMLAAFASSLLLILYGLMYSPWTGLGLLVCGIWFTRESGKLIWRNLDAQLSRSAFRSINIYALCVMSLLILDALLA